MILFPYYKVCRPCVAADPALNIFASVVIALDFSVLVECSKKPPPCVNYYARDEGLTPRVTTLIRLYLTIKTS